MTDAMRMRESQSLGRPNSLARLALVGIGVILLVVLGGELALTRMGDPAKGTPMVIENRLGIDLYIQSDAPSGPHHFFTAVDAHSSEQVVDGCEWQPKLVAREWISRDDPSTQGAEEGDLGRIIETLPAASEECIWVIDGQ